VQGVLIFLTNPETHSHFLLHLLCTHMPTFPPIQLHFHSSLYHTRACACRTLCKQSLWLGGRCTSEVPSADTHCLFTHADFTQTGRKASSVATLLHMLWRVHLHHSMSASVSLNVAVFSHVQCPESRQIGRLPASARSRCCNAVSSSSDSACKSKHHMAVVKSMDW